MRGPTRALSSLIAGEIMSKVRLILMALAMMVFTQPAIAQIGADGPSNTSVSSGSWAIQAIGQNQTPSNSAYTITWAVNKGTAYNFFSFRNTGSFIVSGFQVSVIQVQIGGSGKPPDTTFDLCSNGIWDSTTNTCSGKIVTIGTSADLVLNFTNTILGSGVELSMRATTKPNLQFAFTTTLSASVDRTKVRSGTTINS